jgi:carboxyl-terminal processing protease
MYWRPSEQNIHRTKKNEKDLHAWGVRPDPGFEVPLSDAEQRQWFQARLRRDRWYPPGTPMPPMEAAEKPWSDRALDKAVDAVLRG